MVSVDVDPGYRADFERLLAEQELLDLDAYLEISGYFEEVPLYVQDSQVAFLDGLPFEERNRQLVRAAVAHLGRMLEHARGAGRGDDFFCAVTVTGWEFFAEGDLLIPRFWLANPSHGVFEYVRLRPPASEASRLVASWLDDDPRYLLNEDVVSDFGENRLERVFVQDESCPLPPEVTAPL
jgi:hypothetical protein